VNAHRHAADGDEPAPRLLGPAEIRDLAELLDVTPTKKLGQNFVHDANTVRRIVQTAGVQPGETVLEIGPGTGYYSLDVASWIAPGTLHVFDLQQEMLDHTMRRAAEQGIENIQPTQGDARQLPYGDATFDAAYLVTVLGEIPDQERALAELQRVLKPGARLVVGELFGDPHMVGIDALQQRAHDMTLEDRVGPRFGYFARLRTPAARG
jgi:ubiquinone/menaquinone biosynthesis C-methylase UbiE